MKQTAYCLPIIKKTKKEIMALIQKHREEYQYFEIWIDYIDNFDDIFLQELLFDLQEKLIVVLRRQNLEKIKMPLRKRFDIIALLNNSRAFLDLDISIQKKELAYIKETKVKLKIIISYHNYQETPEDKKLQKVIETMFHYNPTISKIATMCKTEQDSVRLLQILLVLKKQKKHFIILGMGELGIITRIYGTLWGNEIAFAPELTNEASAPGQLTKLEVETILNILDINLKY